MKVTPCESSENVPGAASADAARDPSKNGETTAAAPPCTVCKAVAQLR